MVLRDGSGGVLGLVGGWKGWGREGLVREGYSYLGLPGWLTNVALVKRCAYSKHVGVLSKLGFISGWVWEATTSTRFTSFGSRYEYKS